MQTRRVQAVVAGAVLAIFIGEAVALGALTWAFVFRRVNGSARTTDLREILVGAIAFTALSVMALTALALVAAWRSTRRDTAHTRSLAVWAQVWIGVVLRGEARPVASALSKEAGEALLRLRTVLRGDDEETITLHVQAYGVDRQLIEQLRRQRRSRCRARGSRKAAALADILDALEMARLPEAVPELLSLVRDPDRTISSLALRALASSVRAISDDEARATAHADLAAVLKEVALPRGVISETLTLLEDDAPDVIEHLLAAHDTPEHVTVLALDAIGRLRLLDLAAAAAARIPRLLPSEVRAAALRALAQLGYLPSRSRPCVVEALHDANPAVRVQATHAAYLLPFDHAIALLEAQLADRSWWVRRAAAYALVSLGHEGLLTLIWAAATHTDRFARQIATQALLDTAHIEPRAADALREAA